MACHPRPSRCHAAAPAAARGRHTRGRVGSLFASTAIHAALVCGSLLAHGSRAPDLPTPVAFAVERSLLAHDAAAAAPPEAAEVRVEVETTREDPVVDPALQPPPEAIEPPPNQVPAPSEPRHIDDSRLQRLARMLVRPPPCAEPAIAAVPLPIEAPPAAAASTPQVARPDVPVVIPGQNPAPDYPAFARRRSIEGTVLVRIDVDAGGAAAACTVVASSGCTSLDFAALTAARRWRFTNGPGAVEVPFVFQIRG